MDFKLQVDQSKCSLRQFHHFKWYSNYKPTSPNEICNYLTCSNGLIPIFQAIPDSGYNRTCSNGLQVTTESIRMDFRLQENPLGWTLGYNRTHSDGLQITTKPVRWTLGYNRTHSDGLQITTKPVRWTLGHNRTHSNGLCYNPTKLDGLSVYTIQVLQTPW